MQVTSVRDLVTHATLGGAKTRDFGISDSADFFNILSSALYKNPKFAFIRETLCNAWDAHIDAGRTDTAMEISLDKDKLVIRDFGKGISDEMIQPIYGIYGGSTKSHDGKQTGGFGLGCKAPFAYVEHFEVQSMHGGIRNIYNMSKSSADAKGKPGIIPIADFPTTETGLKVTIQIKQGDQSTLEQYIRRVVANGGMKATLNGNEVKTLPWDAMKQDFLIAKYKFLDDESHSILLRYGNVVYPIEKSELSDECKVMFKEIMDFLYYIGKGKVSQYNRYSAPTDFKIVFQAPAHSISVMPSREGLLMVEHTTNTIKEMFELFISRITHKLRDACALPVRAIVKAAVVDTEKVTFYKTDGETIVIRQGDPRLAGIMEVVTGPLSRREPVEINLSIVTVNPKTNPYADYEKEGSKLVRFFKVARKAVEDFFTAIVPAEADPIQPQVLGDAPQHTQAPAPSPAQQAEKAEAIRPISSALKTVAQIKAEEEARSLPVQVSETEQQKQVSAVAEIMKNAVPVSDPSFRKNDVDHSDKPIEDMDPQGETIVAVVNGPAGPTVIPNVERMHNHIQAAVETGTGIQGIELFLQRLAKVVGKGNRRHSVDDLMGFVKLGDLPIADDGCIVAYKLLNRHDSGRRFVDVQSRKVLQSVGSLVIMDESLVDPDRHQDCSNGLHIAARSYLGGFSGNVMVLVKIRPEDVIAVPAYNRNKMRVCAYHIIAELPDAAKNRLRNNQPMDDTPFGRALLADAIAGRHIGIIEEVRIRAAYGGNLLITKMEQEVVTSKVTEDGAKEVVSVTQDEPIENKPSDFVDPLAVVKVATPDVVVNRVESALPGSRKEQALKLHAVLEAAATDLERRKAAQALLDFKKTSKVGWDKLGLPDDIMIDIAGILDLPIPKTDAQIKREATEKTEAEQSKAKKQQQEDAAVPAKVLKAPTRVEQAQVMLDSFRRAHGKKDAQDIAQKLVDFKRKSKVSWTELGIQDADVAALGQATKQAVADESVKPVPAPTLVKKVQPTRPVPTKAPKAPAPVAAPASTKPQSYSQRIAAMLPVNSKTAAEAVAKLKKESKKGWPALNVDEATVKDITFWLVQK